MGKPTINGNVQKLCSKLPEGNIYCWNIHRVIPAIRMVPVLVSEQIMMVKSSRAQAYLSGRIPKKLVGGIPTPLKNLKVSWDYSSQYMEKNVPNHQPGKTPAFLIKHRTYPVMPSVSALFWGRFRSLSVSQNLLGVVSGRFQLPCFYHHHCRCDQHG